MAPSCSPSWMSLPNVVITHADSRSRCTLLAWQLWKRLSVTDPAASSPRFGLGLCGSVSGGSTAGKVRLASTAASSNLPESPGAILAPDESVTQPAVPAGSPEAHLTLLGGGAGPHSRTSKALGRRRDLAGGAHGSASAGGGSAAAAAAAAPEAPSPGLLSVLGAMAGLFRAGAGGPGAGLGVGHATFGLQALARLHEERHLTDHPAGLDLIPGAASQAEAERLLEALELAHGAYRKSAASLAAKTCLRAKQVRVWRPEGGSLQPGYYVAVDTFGRRVVWGVRGTRVFSDLLTDLAMAAHPLGSGSAHWGMTHAAHWMLQQEASRVAALLRSLGPVGSYRLQLVGHSLGGAVAALAAVMLRERLVEAARAAAIPPEMVSCVAFAPAACMSPPLAELCRPYVTSVVLNNDIVPRFNAASLARLHEELRDVDWYGELQRTVMEHTLVKSLSTTLGALAPAPTSGPPGAAQALPQPQQEQLQVQPPAGAVAAALVPPPAPRAAAAGAAAMVQQLSAAVLESAAFKSAVQSLDEWKTRAMAAAGDQAEATMRRQLELVQTWLQDMAAVKRSAAAAAAADGDDGASTQQGREQEGGATADVRRAAEAAAERLRQSVESAMASLTAAAAASLPPLPSLPQPHELPLVEAKVAAAATAKGAAPSTVAAAADAAGASAAPTSLWDGATASAVSGEAGAASAASAATTGAAMAAAGASVSQPMQLGHTELPLLLPPGRIFYIRPQPKQQNEQTPSGGDSGGALSHPRPPCGPGYVMSELPSGEGFRRLVLGRSALEEHQCRAYRRVLTQLAFPREQES